MNRMARSLQSGLSFIVVLLLVIAVVPWTAVHGVTKLRKVEVRFVKSPFADYLIYLLYRSTGRGRFQEIRQAVPLDDIPTLDELISLPGVAASAQVRSYAELQPLLEPYRDARSRVIEKKQGHTVHYSVLGYSETLPAFEKLSHIVALGKDRYPRFVEFWEQKIAPEEDKTIAAWRDQLNSGRPFEKLQNLSRLAFPARSIDIVAIGLHGAGSANTYPWAIYTGLSVRNVAWAIGHEGTHLLVDPYAGSKWMSRPRAGEAIRLVEERGASRYDIEEALCLLMQVKVSQAAGLTPSDFRLSKGFTEPSVKREILVALEDGWQDYERSARDLIDFLLEQTIYAMSQPRARDPAWD